VGEDFRQGAGVVVGRGWVEKALDVGGAQLVLRRAEFPRMAHCHNMHPGRVFFLLKRILICIDPIEC